MRLRQIDNSDSVEVAVSKTVTTETFPVYKLKDLYEQLEAIKKQRDEQSASRAAELEEVQGMIDAINEQLPDLAAQYEAQKNLIQPADIIGVK
jgi:hypothetical protein